MQTITPKELFGWCKIPVEQLENNSFTKVPFRICKNSNEMGELMARELIDEIVENNTKDNITRAIIPCGPNSWYKPFTQIVNQERVSLKKFIVFHMDECLDWQGCELSQNHPYSFRGFMERNFYNPKPCARISFI